MIGDLRTSGSGEAGARVRAVHDFGPTDFTYLHTDSPSAPSHWAMILELAADGPALSLAAVRERVAARIGRYEVFRIGVRGGVETAPEIVVADEIDLAVHVTEQVVQRAADLDGQIAHLLAEPLPRPAPMWNLTLLTVAATERQYVVLKVHHSLSDGIAGAAFAALLADGESAELSEFDRFGASPRFRVGTINPDQLAASRTAFEAQWIAGDAGRAWPALTESGDREVARYAVSTKELRRAAKYHQSSVHAFLIAAIGTTLSIAPPPSAQAQAENIRVTLPVTLDPSYRHTGNAVAISLLNLAGNEPDLRRQIQRAQAELELTERERLELALAAVDDAPVLPWSEQRHLVRASMQRMSPDIHIGINPGFSRVRSVLGRSITTLTAFSPLVGYSFSVTGLILGSHATFGVVADAASLPGYPARFAEQFAAVVAKAAPPH